MELTEDQHALLVYALGIACGRASTDNTPLAKSILELTLHIVDERIKESPAAT